MSETRSPLARLVLMMVCLSIAGTFVAGVHYVAVDLPQQNAVQVPENLFVSGSSCACDQDLASCRSTCTGGMFNDDYYCEMECWVTYRACQARC
ncbi:MAG: hypothetical protein WC379_12325 [Methanoregula sp.]